MSLEDDFPQLKNGYYKITSPQDIGYNCMAWAMEENFRWWEPSDAGYWPTGIENVVSQNCYTKTFNAMGFSECNSDSLEPCITKIAVYVQDGEVTHIARQLDSGKWTSKLGSDVDIEHDLECLEGDILGRVTLFYSRKN